MARSLFWEPPGWRAGRFLCLLQQESTPGSVYITKAPRLKWGPTLREKSDRVPCTAAGKKWLELERSFFPTTTLGSLLVPRVDAQDGHPSSHIRQTLISAEEFREGDNAFCLKNLLDLLKRRVLWAGESGKNFSRCIRSRDLSVCCRQMENLDNASCSVHLQWHQGLCSFIGKSKSFTLWPR